MLVLAEQQAYFTPQITNFKNHLYIPLIVGKTKSWIQSIVILLILILIFSISAIVNILTDYMWFDAMGFSKIFLITLQSKIFLFAISFILFLAFAGLNIWLSSRFIKENLIPRNIKVFILLAISFIVGISISSRWFIVLQYLNQVNFNLADPIFFKDVSFYIFSLPFYLTLWNFAMATVVVTIILVLLDYFQSSIKKLTSVKQTASADHANMGYDTNRPVPSFDFTKIFTDLTRKQTIHLSILASLFFVLLTIRHYLSLFSIMYSEKGIVVGAGYTDVIVYLPILKILMVIAIAVAVLFIIWIFYSSKRLKKRYFLLYAIFIYLLFVVVGGTMIPGIVQSLKVSPNEINLEKPYINNNIEFTRIAYGLDDVEEKEFVVNQDITPQKIALASDTIDNVRILDWRPLIQTYKQTQEMRLYYDLSGIDIDRYNIDGKYTQVMIAPRELNQQQIAANAQTWVNLHMIYSHGYGVVMSPVNRVTKQGLPDYLIKDIPPVYTVDDEDIKIDRPEIYYGEMNDNFMLVKTNTNEFNYPKGNTNEYNSYDGRGGVTLDSFGKKLLMALRFKDIKILLSSDMTPESRIMFIRNIQERINRITPFLALDKDPYLVINNGRVYWMQDAYTISGNYPYSQKMESFNYIRNSVKVVVDAYNGDVTYYIMDRNDPLIMTYGKIFPKQFKLFSAMPEGLKQHIRYPEDLFSIQSQIYNTYHMNDPTVFYNKEDAWQIPNEIYGINQQTVMEPYYIIIKLPGEDRAEFVIMSPFTPIKKNNMVSWMAARSDKDEYGKLILYKFQKDELVYGPLQIEAKIDQDSEISQQLTLWSQQGSHVTRGNLLVIPIEDSILYIEPLYLQAETGQLPELKRVIVSDGETVVMEKDLATSLEMLFGKEKVQQKEGEELTYDELIEEANAYYENILQSMAENDWSGIGDNMDNLGEILEYLKS